MKDYCTMFPEYVQGIYIGDCCKIHDDTCSTMKFFRCLKSKLSEFVFNIEIAFLITVGGTIGCLVKYTKKTLRVNL